MLNNAFKVIKIFLDYRYAGLSKYQEMIQEYFCAVAFWKNVFLKLTQGQINIINFIN